jgi:hypothetical protein
MKNKLNTYAWLYTSTGASHLFCIFWAMKALEPSASEQSTFAAASGFAFIASLALIVMQLPVFILLYIAIALIVKKNFQQRISIMGNILLLIAVSVDIGLWWHSGNEHSQNNDPVLLIFAPPILIAIVIWSLILPSFFPKENPPANKNKP